MCIEAITAALYCSESKAGAKLVLIAIADGINRSTNCWYAYVDEIADASGYTRRFTTTQIWRLVKSGELVVEQIHGRRCNYYIPLLPGEDGYEPSECTENHDCNGFHTPLSIARGEAVKRRRKAHIAADRKRTRATRLRNDSSHEREFIGTIVPAPRNDSSQDIGTIVPAPRNDSSLDVLIEYNPSTISVDNPSTGRARPSPQFQKTDGALAIAEPSTPPAPPPPAAAQRQGTEARALWRDLRARLADRRVSAAELEVMASAHLYRLNGSQWCLHVPPGADVGMWRSRYEGAVTDALCAELRRGNQIVEFSR